MASDLQTFLPAADRPYRAALFLSGYGSNAAELLERQRRTPSRHYEIVLLVTDAPERGRARELAAQYGLPLAELDIRTFYRDRGLDSITLATAAGRETRESWTAELRKRVAPHRIDFGVLAGFVPLTNLTSDFPCLNVHPGDLSVTGEDGRRLLAGLHAGPMETALCRGFLALRSSVIVAQPYSGTGGEMDSGPILGLSEPVPARLEGHTPEELEAVRLARPPGRRPPDLLAHLAAVNLERLKFQGDHLVLPPTVEAFAAGCYRYDENGLYFRDAAGEFQMVETVEYGRDLIRPIRRQP